MISHMLHNDLKDTWDMWIVKTSTELKKWNRLQEDGSATSGKTKVARGLTKGCVEEVILKVRDSFFMKFAAR